MSVRSRSNWNLKVLVFKERGKPEYSGRKTSRSKGENQQQTQPTYGVDARIPTQATLVGGELRGECSHHCATLAPLSKKQFRYERQVTINCNKPAPYNREDCSSTILRNSFHIRSKNTRNNIPSPNNVSLMPYMT